MKPINRILLPVNHQRNVIHMPPIKTPAIFQVRRLVFLETKDRIRQHIAHMIDIGERLYETNQ